MVRMAEKQQPPDWLKYCGPNWFGEQDENGVDLSLIRENLRLSPEERLLKNDRIVDGLRELIEHGRKKRCKPPPGSR